MEANREKQQQYHATYYQEHKEKYAYVPREGDRKARHAAAVKRWRNKNLVAIKAARAAQRRNNPEQAKAQDKAYRDAHKDEVAASAKRSRERHPDKHYLWQWRWRQANPDKVRAHKKAHLARMQEALFLLRTSGLTLKEVLYKGD